MKILPSCLNLGQDFSSGVSPEVFNSVSEVEAGNFGDWLMYFESVAKVNEWDEAAKLAWLMV